MEVNYKKSKKYLFLLPDSLEWDREDDLRSESGGHDKLDLTKCKTIFFDHVCNKIDCGEC